MILQIRCATNKPSARKNKCNYVFILKSKFCFNLFTLRLESLCHFKDCLLKLKCIYNNWRYLLFNIGMLSHTFGLVEECYFFAVYYGAWFEVFACLPSQGMREEIRVKTSKRAPLFAAKNSIVQSLSFCWWNNISLANLTNARLQVHHQLPFKMGKKSKSVTQNTF